MATEKTAVAATPPDDAKAFAVARAVLRDLCDELAAIKELMRQNKHDRILWLRLGRVAQIVIAADAAVPELMLQRIESPAVSVCWSESPSYSEAVIDVADTVLNAACNAANIKRDDPSDVAVLVRDAATKKRLPRWNERRLLIIGDVLEGFRANDVSNAVAAELRQAARVSLSRLRTKSSAFNVERIEGSARRYKIDRKPVRLSPACAKLFDGFIELKESGEATPPLQLMTKLGLSSKADRKQYEDTKRRFNKALKEQGVAKGLYVVSGGDVLDLCKKPKKTPAKVAKKNVKKTSGRR